MKKISSKFKRGYIAGVFSGMICVGSMVAAASMFIEPATNDLFESEQLGISDFGVDIPQQVIPQQVIQDPEYKPVTLKSGCKWGNPGSKPFNGDVYSALRALGVDKDSAIQITEQIKQGSSTEEVVFDNFGVRDRASPQQYEGIYSTTFANTVCYGTKTRFKPDHFELGKLYKYNGYYIAVPYICNNVTRLTPITNTSSNKEDSYSQGYVDGYRDALVGKQMIDAGNQRREVHTVPEPSSIALMVIGMLIMRLRKLHFQKNLTN